MFFEKKKREKKESLPFQKWGFRRQGFVAKYDPNGWRFCEKPEGLDLDVKRPRTNFAIFFVNFDVSIPERTHWGNSRRRRKANHNQNKVAKDCS